MAAQPQRRTGRRQRSARRWCGAPERRRRKAERTGDGLSATRAGSPQPSRAHRGSRHPVGGRRGPGGGGGGNRTGRADLAGRRPGGAVGRCHRVGASVDAVRDRAVGDPTRTRYPGGVRSSRGTAVLGSSGMGDVHRLDPRVAAGGAGSGAARRRHRGTSLHNRVRIADGEHRGRIDATTCPRPGLADLGRSTGSPTHRTPLRQRAGRHRRPAGRL